jgi:hypothetical protein
MTEKRVPSEADQSEPRTPSHALGGEEVERVSYRQTPLRKGEKLTRNDQ